MSACSLAQDPAGPAPEFRFFVEGLCYVSVCTGLPLEEATQRLNEEHPPDIGRWLPVDHPFDDGSSNPHPCRLWSGHTHYLFML